VKFLLAKRPEAHVYGRFLWKRPDFDGAELLRHWRIGSAKTQEKVGFLTFLQVELKRGVDGEGCGAYMPRFSENASPFVGAG